MARSKKSKSPKPKRPTLAQARVGIVGVNVQPDLTAMGGTYKIKKPTRPRISSGVGGVGSKGAIRRARSGK